MSYFIYTDFINSLLDPKLVDPGSALIRAGKYGPKLSKREICLHYYSSIIYA